MQKSGYPLLFTFNPITGSPQTTQPQILNYRIYQATMLPLPVSEENIYSKPVLILDRDLKVSLVALCDIRGLIRRARILIPHVNPYHFASTETL